MIKAPADPERYSSDLNVVTLGRSTCENCKLTGHPDQFSADGMVGDLI